MSKAASQHTGLDAEHWRRFDLDRQVLMIANEMHRARRFLEDASGREHLRSCYQRVLRLVDLTVEVNKRTGLRRELLRLREVIGTLYLSDSPMHQEHRAALRVLLQLRPNTAGQLAYL